MEFTYSVQVFLFLLRLLLLTYCLRILHMNIMCLIKSSPYSLPSNFCLTIPPFPPNSMDSLLRQGLTRYSMLASSSFFFCLSLLSVRVIGVCQTTAWRLVFIEKNLISIDEKKLKGRKTSWLVFQSSWNETIIFLKVSTDVYRDHREQQACVWGPKTSGFMNIFESVNASWLFLWVRGCFGTGYLAVPRPDSCPYTPPFQTI